MANEYHEFLRSYDGCFIAVKPQSTPTPRPYVVVGPSATVPGEVEGYLILKSLKERMVRYSFEYLQQNMTPIVPSAGYFNVQHPFSRPTCVYVAFDPARQFKKGFDAEGNNHRVSVTSGGSPSFLQELRDLEAQGNKYNVLAKLLTFNVAANPTRVFPDFYTALRAVESGSAHSVAISRFISLGLHKGLELPAVMFKNQFAGAVYKGRLYGDQRLYPQREFIFKRWGVEFKNFMELKSEASKQV